MPAWRPPPLRPRACSTRSATPITWAPSSGWPECVRRPAAVIAPPATHRPRRPARLAKTALGCAGRSALASCAESPATRSRNCKAKGYYRSGPRRGERGPRSGRAWPSTLKRPARRPGAGGRGAWRGGTHGALWQPPCAESLRPVPSARLQFLECGGGVPICGHTPPPPPRESVVSIPDQKKKTKKKSRQIFLLRPSPDPFN